MGFDAGQHTRPAGLRPAGRRVLLGVALLALAACDTVPGATQGTTHVAAIAGAPTPTAVLAFPQQVPLPSPRPLMAARLEGTLALVDGCLRVTTPYGANPLIVWPAEATLRNDGGDIRVVASDGRVIGRVGESIVLGGGEISAPGGQVSTPVRALLREPPPTRCPGPYWLAHFIEGPPASPTRGT